MGRVCQGIQHREVIAARCRYVGKQSRSPAFAKQRVLALELVAFVAANAGDQGGLAGHRHPGGAEPEGRLCVELEVDVQKTRMPDGFQIVDAANRNTALDQVSGKIRIPDRSERAHRHCGQVPAGRVAGNDNA